jgi:hypothetical protein
MPDRHCNALDSAEARPAEAQPTPRLGVIRWCLVFVVALLLYTATAQRGVSWQDSGMFQWRCLTADYSGRLGLALAHPLYIFMGRLPAAVGISETHLPFLLNALSGVGMAVALATLAAVGARLTGKPIVGILVAAMLAVCHSAWWLSTIAEVYTWSVAGLAVELYLLVLLLRNPRWRTLAGLAAVNGLGLCIHNFALLPLPVYVVVAVGLVIRRRLPAWTLAAAAAAYLLGAGPYLAMTAELAIRSGDTLGAVKSALVSSYGGKVFNLSGWSKHGKANLILSGMSFVNLLLPLAVLGWIRMRRQLGGATAAALGAITVIEILFFARYTVPDQFTFILPSMMMISVAACVGLAALWRVSGKWRVATAGLCLLSVVGAPAVYSVAAAQARSAGGQVRSRKLPFRDEVRYWLIPWKNDEQSARQFAEAALAEVPPNAIILADSTSVYPLRISQRIENLRPDVTIRTDSPFADVSEASIPTVRKALAARPLCVVAADPKVDPTGLLKFKCFRLHRRKGNILHMVVFAEPQDTNTACMRSDPLLCKKHMKQLE